MTVFKTLNIPLANLFCYLQSTVNEKRPADLVIGELMKTAKKAYETKRDYARKGNVRHQTVLKVSKLDLFTGHGGNS